MGPEGGHVLVVVVLLVCFLHPNVDSVTRPHVGSIKSPATCHFLPLGRTGRDEEPALLPAAPAPLEGSPQVIREGRPLSSRPMGRRRDVDDKCARRLYLRLGRREGRRLRSNGLFTWRGRAPIPSSRVMLAPRPQSEPASITEGAGPN